jgi:hypothetical protein
MHWLVVRGKIKQRTQERFEKFHQLLGRSNELLAVEKAEDGASIQQSS